MIFNIRGPSGSGKTYVARQVMDLYGEKLPRFVPGRKQPLYYHLREPGYGDLLVLGHYETACGGCDTIKTLDETFQLARLLAVQGHVLFEGLLLSPEYNRTVALSKADNMEVLFLDTPLEQCIENIRKRRAARGVTKPWNVKNTKASHRSAERCYEKLEAAGVLTIRAPQSYVFDRIERRLGN